MSWHLAGTYLESCSCEPGCSCNFRGVPNSKEGNCEAFGAHRIEDGSFDGLNLAGAKVGWALWWPGAIHDRGGRGRAFVDCATDEQFEALSRIWRGEVGYSYFEVFNSTFDEPTAVERAAIDITVDGRRSSWRVGERAETVMEPLLNPVTHEENDVRIVKPGGFIWKDGHVAQSNRMRVDVPGISFDLSGRHCLIAPFEYRP